MEGWCFLFGDGASRGHNSSNNRTNASTSAESVASAETVYYRRGGEAGKEKACARHKRAQSSRTEGRKVKLA